MVLLAGDLFHENKPSRQSLYHVVKTLREACYGDKPCELELISDPSLSLNDAYAILPESITLHSSYLIS